MLIERNYEDKQKNYFHLYYMSDIIDSIEVHGCISISAGLVQIQS